MLRTTLVIALLSLGGDLTAQGNGPGRPQQARRGGVLSATPLPNQVAAGDITHDSALLWAKANSPGLVAFVIAQRADFRGPKQVRFGWTPDALLPVKLDLQGLTPGTTYHYLAVEPFGGSATGRFRTAHAQGVQAGLRFGVSGDQRGELAPFPAVANAAARDLDFFVNLGDTIYADYPSPALPIPQAMTLRDYRIKHAEIYSERYGEDHLADLRASTAWFATVDDHEVINDFSGGAAPASDPRFPDNGEAFINETTLFANGYQAFFEYHPLRDTTYGATGDPRTAGKPKLYRAPRFGDDAQIFILDNRSFRDAPVAPVTDPTDLADIQRFLTKSLDPTRTMLGREQLQDLLADLLAAEQSGVTWKFVMVPEPIQNLGVVFASDRFEGYSHERTVILQWIDSHNIDNVVFVAADLHGTYVNDVNYQLSPTGPQIPTGSFEVITGAVAFDAPLGPSVAQIANDLGLLSNADFAAYQAAAIPGSAAQPLQDAFIEALTAVQLLPFGYSLIGLQDSAIQATLLTPAPPPVVPGSPQPSGYTAVHTYGWTEFEVDAATQDLTITTWGIAPYSEAALNADPAGVLSRAPQVVQQFRVTPR